MLYSHHRNSVFAEKGSAAPSQDDRVARHQTSSYAPVARHVQVSEENLSGLIKRTPHPVRPNLPELSDSSPQSAKKTSDDDGNVIDINVSGLIRRGDLNRSGDPCAAAPSPVSGASQTARKQLTVRISMTQFGRLDRIASRTGRTGRSYQDLQISAIERYLTRFE